MNDTGTAVVPEHAMNDRIRIMNIFTLWFIYSSGITSACGAVVWLRMLFDCLFKR